MYFNGSSVTQVFYAGREPFEVNSKFFFFLPKCVAIPTEFKYYKSPINSDLVNAADTIVIKRLGALGDILMLAPVVNQIKDEFGKKVKLVVGENYLNSKFIQVLAEGVFDELIPYLSFSKLATNEIGIDFTGVMELDYSFSDWKYVPRVDIYRKLLGLDTSVPLVWRKSPFPWFDKEWIVFSSGGSTAIKTIPIDIATFIIDGLCDKGYGVVHNRDEKGLRLEAEDMIGYLLKAKCLITTDSAPLWMSHFTDTPVCFIHGPSRTEERLAHHPLRPEGVCDIDLAKQVNCEPCFEDMQACKGAVDCFNKIDKSELLKLILDGVDRVSWKT